MDTLGQTRRKLRRVLGRLGVWIRPWGRRLEDESGFWELALSDPDRYWSAEEFRDRLNPVKELQVELKELVKTGQRDVSILDVGAGPLTTLGTQWPGRNLRITAIDPLAEQYARLIKRLNLAPPVITIPGHGEKLVDQFGRECFDIAYASNSLDHSYDPVAAIAQMMAVTKAGGHVYLWHFENEGTEQDFAGLHQWDFYVDNGDFVIRGAKGTQSVCRALGESAKHLHCRRMTAFGKPVVVAVIEKAEVS